MPWRLAGRSFPRTLGDTTDHPDVGTGSTVNVERALSKARISLTPLRFAYRCRGPPKRRSDIHDRLPVNSSLNRDKST
jgi:hypothetical protein